MCISISKKCDLFSIRVDNGFETERAPEPKSRISDPQRFSRKHVRIYANPGRFDRLRRHRNVCAKSERERRGADLYQSKRLKQGRIVEMVGMTLSVSDHVHIYKAHPYWYGYARDARLIVSPTESR
jgi:hypothetical protein